MKPDQPLLHRILEPEVMDTAEEAAEYDTMNHSAVNRLFVDDLLSAWGKTDAQQTSAVLDVGTGTALIPIELAKRVAHFRITAIDLSAEMLKLADQNVSRAGLADRIKLERVDAKQLQNDTRQYELVISNSIVHHLPDPRPALEQMVQRVSQGGMLFVRDLMRPKTRNESQQLVDIYAAGANKRQRSLFYDSLCAALSLEEMEAIVRDLPLSQSSVAGTSDRHWTMTGKR